MSTGKFRKKPVVVEAFQMTQEHRQDNKDWPEWLNRAWNKDHSEPGAVFPSKYPDSDGTDELLIYTLEGVHRVEFDDWIIRGVKGELYPCKPDIFEATYEREENAMNNESIEQEIQAKGLTAPRITPDDIEANIVSEHYFTARDGRRGALADGTYVGRERPRPAEEDLAALDLLTFCVLVMKNGFTVTGESACASPENFDAELGRKIARQNAVEKIWPLMGYELKSRLANSKAL